MKGIGAGKRVFYFLVTNIAILAVISVIFAVFGVGRILDEQGIGLDYTALLIYSAVIGFAGSILSLAMSKWLAKRMTGARVIERPANETERWLVTKVQEYSRRSGIMPPEVAIYESDDPNAFATGARRNAALVAVSTGLLRRMKRDEVEAVLAHEVAHVANGDMVTLTLIQGVVNTFVIFLSRVIGFVVDRAIFRTQRGTGPGFWITAIVMQILLGILASMIVMWFSRRREYAADRGSARLVGAPAMISALERLRSDQPVKLPESMAAFGIRGKASSLFSSHPPIEARIAALKGEGGGARTAA
jgi:heat shock protein HtpX